MTYGGRYEHDVRKDASRARAGSALMSATPVSFRWSPEFIEAIDKARGSTSRSEFVRVACALRIQALVAASGGLNAAFSDRRDPGPEGSLAALVVRRDITKSRLVPERADPPLVPFAGAATPVDTGRHVQISPKLMGGIAPRPKVPRGKR